MTMTTSRAIRGASPDTVVGDPSMVVDPRTGRNGRRMISVALRWGLPLVALGFLARSLESGWDEMIDSLSAIGGSQVTLLVGALAVEVAWTVSLSRVYRSSLMALGGRTSRLRALRVSMGAFTLSRILPGGGAVGALFAGREFIREGNSGPVTLVALIVAGWISLTTLAWLVWLAIFVGFVKGTLHPSALIPPALISIALALAGVFVVGSLRRPNWRLRVVGIVEDIFSKWSSEMPGTEFETVLVSRTTKRRRNLVKVVSWAATSWVFDALALWLVFAAFDQRLSLGALAIGYGAANLIQALPEVTPGWLGVLEGSLAVVYSGFGIPLGVAVLAVLAYRLVSFWIPVIAGLPWAISILRASGQRRRS